MKIVSWRKFFLMMMVLSAVSVAEAVPNAGAPVEVAEGLLPAFGCDVLPEGGVLLAEHDDVHGEEITEEDLLDPAFWKRLWGDDIDTIISKKSDGRTAPWYKGSDNPGLPIQRANQDNFYTVPKEITGVQTISNSEDFLELLGAGDGGFSLGGGGLPDSFDLTLDGDLDLGGATINPIETFKGVLDGQGHTISNFKIEGDGENTAFIGTLYGEVKGLVIENASVSSTGSHTAIVAGTVDGGKINNCLIKDCELDGYNYMGMVAGEMKKNGLDFSYIENCLVVNGNITCRGDNLYIGGLTGGTPTSSLVQGYVRNSVCMLDMFKLHCDVLKSNTRFGRVTSSYITKSNLYGWGETGFALWNAEKGDYTERYYPNWSATATQIGTKNVGLNRYHGENLFVGDANPSSLTLTSQKSIDSNFWRNKVYFDASIWEFPAGAQYPRPIGSTVATNELIARRGFELDQSAHSAYTNTDIHTALMFTKMYNKDVGGSSYPNLEVKLYTDIDLNPQTLWGISLIDNSTHSLSDRFIKTNYGTFDGQGHSIKNLYFFNGGYTSAMSFIGYNQANSSLKRLSFTNLKLEGTPSYSTAKPAGVVGTNKGEVANCFVGLTTMTIGSIYGFSAGAVVGQTDFGSKIINNIVELGTMQTNNPANKNSYLGGFLGISYYDDDFSGNFLYCKSDFKIENSNSSSSYSYVGKFIGYKHPSYADNSSNYYFSEVEWTTSNYRSASGSYEEAYADESQKETSINTSIWGSSKMDLDDQIWDIPTGDGKLPTLKKVWKEW